MAAPKKSGEKADHKSAQTVVLVPFAYATRNDGEIRQLVKGDVVGDGYTKESLAHLESIGFIGKQD